MNLINSKNTRLSKNHRYKLRKQALKRTGF